jgi:hypothetical protein
MRLDLRRDFSDLYSHIVNRVRRFDPATNDGPGTPGPVSMIEVGFDYSQSAWVAVVFHTRPDAKPDGEWNSHIESNAFERPHWLEAGEANMDGPIQLVQLDGTEVELPEGTELAVPLGELITAVLLKARSEGVFATLSKTPGCMLCVEHHEGAYGWPGYEALGKVNLA